MPGIVRTSSSPIYTDFDLTTFLAECDALIAEIQPGVKITADQSERLRKLYNNFQSHVHTAYDQFFEAFGNLGNVSTSGTKTTSIPVGMSPISTPITPGTKITEQIIDDFVLKINNIKTHYHTIVDTSE